MTWRQSKRTATRLCLFAVVDGRRYALRLDASDGQVTGWLRRLDRGSTLAQRRDGWHAVWPGDLDACRAEATAWATAQVTP